MTNIFEVPAGELDKVVEFVKENWGELARRPFAQSQEQELSFWQQFLRGKRILIYRGEDGEIQGLLTCTKESDEVRPDHLLVKKESRGHGIGSKLLQMAERFAVIWKAKRVVLCGREDQGDFLEFFYRLGYTLHCPVDQQGLIFMEKRLN